MNYQDRIEASPDEGFATETIDVSHEPAFDDMVSFVDESAILESNPAEGPTSKHVLWQFPEEALLAARTAHDLPPTRKLPFLASLAAAVVLGGAIVGIWQSIPWSDLLSKRPSDNVIAIAPQIKPPADAPSRLPGQLISSRQVLPPSYQPPASVAGATVASVASEDAAALVMNPPPKPVELSAAPSRQPVAPALTTSIALDASAGRETEPISTLPMVSSNSVTRVDAAEPPLALEPAPAATPPLSRMPAARVEPEAPAPVVARSEPNDIQQALDHYRHAYQRLDAGAAQTVWPSVDVRALARAFDTLASQELVFEACLFDIAGEAATAQCRGTSTYTPKIGNHRPRLEPRQWTFRLRKEAEGWKIQSAQVRQ
jgi:hypothetical protein